MLTNFRKLPGYNDEWLHQTLSQAIHRFDEACDRWRGLIGLLCSSGSPGRHCAQPRHFSREKEEAKRLRAEAESQLALLLDARDMSYSDFYSYRYFAARVLPGYNFPRLPLSAYIPGRRGCRRDDADESLSRPCFWLSLSLGRAASSTTKAHVTSLTRQFCQLVKMGC